MNCEAVQNRLLAVSEPRRAGADVRAHLATCAECKAFVARAGRLEELLAKIPVPASSPAAKADLLTDILSGKPATLKFPAPAKRSAFAVFESVRWTHVVGAAAAVFIGVGVWAVSNGKKPTDQPETAGLRHELLQKEVKHFVALSKTKSPIEGVTIWTEVAGDLRTEASELYLVAPEDDMKALGKMFDRAVREGIVQQANQFQTHLPAGERQRALDRAVSKLKDAEAEAERLSAAAPPHSQAVLRNMAKTARDGQRQIQELQARGGV